MSPILTSSPITTVDEYDGGPVVAVSATQLGTAFSASRARRVVDDWVAFLADGPSPIHELRFTSRTPARLFAALAGQAQLRRLEVKWGDYSDLSPLREMTGLETLVLRGATRVADVEVLGGLASLRTLEVEGFREIPDPSPLGRLEDLERLELGGDWMGPRKAHLPSLGFLREMRGLTHVLLHTLTVDDLDYSPLLDLPRLQSVRVGTARGMRPSLDELRAALPWADPGSA